MKNINELPEEILEYILYFVSPYDDLKSCRLVCERWLLSCHGVVKKRKLRLNQALKSGKIEWHTPFVSSNINSITKRFSHSSCIHGSSMYVFGGCTATSTTFNDLWKYNLGNHEWTRILTTGTYPSPKAYASIVSWNENLILFGGWTHPSVYPLHQQWVLFEELHIYNALSNRWSQLYYEGNPPPTAGHTATIHDNCMVVFGGLQKHDGLSFSTNELFCLNLITQVWFQPQVGHVLKPDPRYGHAQIKIDERNILIMAGCGGSNKLYNDVWLLTLPENFSVPVPGASWEWKPVSVGGSENTPKQLWYNPACRVEDKVVVLSSWKIPTPESSSTPGKMHQLFMPSVNSWVAPALPGGAEAAPLDDFPVEEKNVNGRRGSLRPPPHVDSTSSESEDNVEGPSKDRRRPSVRPNASSNRAKRLQMLTQMEDRLRKYGVGNSKFTEMKAAESHLVPHLLDIQNVTETLKVSWEPVALNSEGVPPYIGIPPEPKRLLYSLLLGRGHLIMFGGMKNEPGCSREPVANGVTYISPQSLMFTNL